MVYEIFHAFSEGKKVIFRWSIHISTATHGKVLNIIECLDSDVNEATNKVIEGILL